MNIINYERQSNKADWRPDGVELLDENNDPLWTSIPSGMEVILSIGERKCNGTVSPTMRKIFSSLDSPSYVTVSTNGVFGWEIPASSLSDLEPGQYPIFARIIIGEDTDQAIIGELPIVQGG
jgi:hypothetical protein